MDRAEKPLLSLLGGQLKLGLAEEAKKETLWEDLLAFVRGLVFYLHRRIFTLLSWLPRFVLFGFGLIESFKFWLSRKIVRRKGHLSFPLTHIVLVGVTLGLVIATAVFGEFIFQKSSPVFSGLGPSILESIPEFITEESKLLSTKAESYTVQKGDTIYDIAQRFKMTVDTLVSANYLLYPYILHAGDKLTIPPIEGVLYKIRAGDTVQSVARKYSANAQSIIEFNYLFAPYKLVPGSELIVPVYTGKPRLMGGLSPSGTCGSLTLGWPTKDHAIIGSFTYSHRALDFPANYGPLYAAADGTVVAVGHLYGPCFSFSASCNHGYGGYVFINIGGGYQIRYGHISKALVGVGQKVSKGEAVAISGESGVAFGPHFHFELLCNGTKISPLPYLK